MKVKLLDLFSGVGGFRLGLEQAGFEIESEQFSEIDKYAISVYKKQFPEAEYVGSVTDISGKPGQAGIITFGSPCQDFSLAGKRAGMDGERSSLISHAIRLISEIKPKFFIWENVKGTFSSNAGTDFWAIIQAFANIGGYRLEWQLLNTSWFLPQNRERIYLVGTLGGRSEREIFPLGEDGQLSSKPLRQKTVGGGGVQVRPDRIAACLPAGYKTRVDENYIKVPPEKMGIAWSKSHRTGSTEADKRRKNYGEKGEFNTLNTGEGCRTQSSQNFVVEKSTIRRLTPIECERLQGFPDNWTQHGHEGQEISDTQRYKMMGNAVSVPVVKAVGENILLSTKK